MIQHPNSLFRRLIYHAAIGFRTSEVYSQDVRPDVIRQCCHSGITAPASGIVSHLGVYQIAL